MEMERAKANPRMRVVAGPRRHFPGEPTPTARAAFRNIDAARMAAGGQLPKGAIDRAWVDAIKEIQGEEAAIEAARIRGVQL